MLFERGFEGNKGKIVIFLIVFMFGLFAAVGVGALSCLSDLKGMKIPNLHFVIVTIAFFLAWLANDLSGAGAMDDLSSHLKAGGVVLLVGMVMFFMKWIGGGDSKLVAAYSLWIGLPMLPVFLFYMATAGAILGIMALILKKWKPFKTTQTQSWVARVQSGESVVPYGIPIVFGSVVTFILLGYFSPETLGAFLQ